MNTNAHSRPRSIAIPTVRNLENQALFYLSRYASSESGLRRVLENKLRRAAMQNPAFANDDALQNQLHAVIDVIVEKHKKTGALDDAAFAEMKTANWRRAGRSARAIRLRLGKNGVARDLVDQALDQSAEGENAEDAELKAALALAKRRRLGPFRQKSSDDPDRKRKDLAALARAGFSLDVARKVLATRC